MRCLLVITLTALTCLSAPAAAQDAGALSRVRGVERRLELYEAHRGRLERQLDEQSKRIARLKKQPTGVGRDLQLKAALRDSQQLASRLTKMQSQLRELRSNLLSHYAEAIEHAKDDTTRQAWRARRHKLLERSTRHAKATAKLATGTRANALDGVEDLEEKADLLADSEAKVRRQLRRLSRRISRIERRSKLRRHGRAATDTPFVEDSTRRLGGSRRLAPAKIASGRTDGATQGESGPATPAPPPSGNWSGAGDPKAGPGGLNSDAASGTAPAPPAPSATLQRGLDPATVKALGGTFKGSPAQQLAALKKAREKLQKLAQGLAQRSTALRKRASTLKKQPRHK